LFALSAKKEIITLKKIDEIRLIELNWLNFVIVQNAEKELCIERADNVFKQ